MKNNFFLKPGDQQPYEMKTSLFPLMFITIILHLFINKAIADEPEVFIEPSGNINQLCSGSDFGLIGRGLHGTEVFLIHEWESTGENIFAGTDGPFAVIRPTNPGKYTITYTATDAHGNKASSRITVKVFSKPDNRVEISRGFFSRIFGNDMPVILKADDNSSYSYQWFKENELMEGETGSKFKAEEKGSYRLMITSDKGCHAYSKLITIE